MADSMHRTEMNFTEDDCKPSHPVALGDGGTSAQILLNTISADTFTTKSLGCAAIKQE